MYSSDVNDAAAGTGLRTVRLYGQLDGVEQTEDVTLNGTTNVTTTKLWTRMYRMKGLTAGSGGVNAGTITAAHTTTTANVFATMQIGYNRTQIAAYTVPTGNTLYMHSIYVHINRASGAAGSASIALMVRESGGVWETRNIFDITVDNSPTIDVDYTIALPAGTDFSIRCLSVSDNTTSISANVLYILDTT